MTSGEIHGEAIRKMITKLNGGQAMWKNTLDISIELRRQEEIALKEIESITTQEFANASKEILDSTKHTYNFEMYLNLLNDLKKLLLAGLPEETALEMVQMKFNVEEILYFWRLSSAGDQIEWL